MIKFYKTHFKKSLLIQKFKQKKFEIFEKNYSDNDFTNYQTTGDLFKNNDSDPQNVSEVIEVSDSDENENASNSIRIEEKKADLLISIKGDLEASKRNDLQIPGGNDLQTRELPNSIRASQNKANEKEFQIAFDFAKKRIPKFWKHKTMAFTAAFEKSWKKKRAYDFKTFDKKKTSIAFTTKSTNDKIMKLKIYHETITDFDKKNEWLLFVKN